MHWHIGKWFFPRQISLRTPGRWGQRGVLAAMLLSAAATASAQQPQDDYWNWEITPYYGYTAGGKFEDPATNTDRDIEADSNFGVIFNAAVDEWRHYELLYSKQGTEIEGTSPVDLDVEYLQIGGTVSYQDTELVVPYFGLTVGGARLSPDGAGLDDETKLAFSVAGGFKVPITDHIGVRFDVRAFVTLLDSDGDLFCVSANGTGTCGIRAKSDTLLQYSAGLGLIVGF